MNGTACQAVAFFGMLAVVLVHMHHRHAWIPFQTFLTHLHRDSSLILSFLFIVSSCA